jgi:hypothetical protein
MPPLRTLICGVSIALISAVAQDGAATLRGRVQDVNGAAVVGASLELRSEQGRENVLQAKTNPNGMYLFKGLPPAGYSLTAFSPGFRRVRIKSIHISDGEKKSMPILELSVSSPSVLDQLDFFRFLNSPNDLGNLGGAVVLYVGPSIAGRTPVTGAQIALVCPGDRVCGVTKTDSGGHFIFRDLSPGKYGVYARHPGFYNEFAPDYEVQAGRELVYQPFLLEKCHLGNCDPARRPKRPLVILE